MRTIYQKGYVFHFLFWLMYAVFMTLETQGYARQKSWSFSLPSLLIYFALMAFLVYFHTLVLIPLLLQKKKVILYRSGIILLMIAYTLLRTLNQQYWDSVVWPKDLMTFQSYLFGNALYAIWFTLISTLLFFTQKWYEQRQQVETSQINQLKTELKYLRAQVNPHFLFNGLNTIYGSIDRSNHQARDILVQFSDLLRYSLYDADVDWVDLGKETVYLQNYVALQRARSNSNLQIDLKISVEDKTVKIAPLLFMAFVENAFKYSTRDDNRSNRIKIDLRQKQNRITFDCSNSYEEGESVAGGIGLNNVKRRLELLYKDRYALAIRKEHGFYNVQLSLML